MPDEHTDGPGSDSNNHAEQDGDSPLPPELIDDAERLTRLARNAVDDAEADAYRKNRENLLMDHGYTARVREEGRDTLVLYPSEWVEDETIRPDRVDDIDRGIEIPLEGPGSGDNWETVDEHNRDVAETVAREHGDVHGANARALADFASNHYAKPVGELTDEEVTEFLTEYFPRNAFPTDDQKAVVGESVRLAFDAAGATGPTDSAR